MISHGGMHFPVRVPLLSSISAATSQIHEGDFTMPRRVTGASLGDVVKEPVNVAEGGAGPRLTRTSSTAGHHGQGWYLGRLSSLSHLKAICWGGSEAQAM